MEGSGGGGGGRRSLTLLDQMSAIESEPLTRLTLDAVLTAEKQLSAAAAAQTPVNRTLLDIIRDEEPHGSLFGHKDKKSWKALRDRLRLKRAGAAWTSSVHIPASDIPIPVQNNNDNNNNNFRSLNNSRSLMSRRNSVRFTTVSPLDSPQSAQSEDLNDGSAVVSSSRPVMTRRTSTRYLAVNSEGDEQPGSVNIHAVGDMPPVRSFMPQMSRRNSTRVLPSSFDLDDNDEETAAPEGTLRLGAALAEERALSAREAVAAQEAAEAAAAAATEAAEEDVEGEAAPVAEVQPVRMSLMDLLEETDRQMGVVGSRYTVAEVEEEEAEEEEEEEGEEGGGGRVEHTCCVCMVRHKGAAFIPCGHTFCRLCSRELWVQRGNCPLCNGFILEILDIF